MRKGKSKKEQKTRKGRDKGGNGGKEVPGLMRGSTFKLDILLNACLYFSLEFCPQTPLLDCALPFVHCTQHLNYILRMIQSI